MQEVAGSSPASRLPVLERTDRALGSPRRGARLASSATDEEVVEGASDFAATGATVIDQNG
jgi:hypothetical protein